MAQRTVSKRSPGWHQCWSLRKNRSALQATTQRRKKVRSTMSRFPEVMGTGEQALREAFFHNQTVLFGSSYTHTAATGWQRTKWRSYSKRAWDAAKREKTRGMQRTPVSLLPALSVVLPRLCVAGVCLDKSWASLCALGDWVSREESHLKGCAHLC